MYLCVLVCFFNKRHQMYEVNILMAWLQCYCLDFKLDDCIRFNISKPLFYSFKISILSLNIEVVVHFVNRWNTIVGLEIEFHKTWKFYIFLYFSQTLFGVYVLISTNHSFGRRCYRINMHFIFIHLDVTLKFSGPCVFISYCYIKKHVTKSNNTSNFLLNIVIFQIKTSQRKIKRLFVNKLFCYRWICHTCDVYFVITIHKYMSFHKLNTNVWLHLGLIWRF